MYGVANCFVLLGLFGSMDTPSAVQSEPFSSPRFASVEPSVTDAPTPSDTRPQPRPALVDINENHTANQPSTNSNSTPTTTALQNQQHNDAMVQAALTQVLNSPSQMQKLLNALQGQSISADMVMHQPHQPQLIGPYDSAHYGNTDGNDTGMDVHTDHTRSSPYDLSAALGNGPPSPFSLSLLGGSGGNASDADQLVPFEKQDERLQKTYQTAAEISHDVDELQSSINSLIQTLGLDSTLGTSGHHEANGNSTSTGNGSNNNGIGVGGEGDMDMFTNINGPDFDFDSFLMDIPRTTDEDGGDLERLAEQLDPTTAVAAVHDPQARLGGTSSEQFHAFLDEVASQDGSDTGLIPGSSHLGFAPVSTPGPAARPAPRPRLGSSHSLSSTLNDVSVPNPSGAARPPTSSATSVLGPTASRGRKRKSEVADAEVHVPPLQAIVAPSSSVAPSKSKRKR